MSLLTIVTISFVGIIAGFVDTLAGGGGMLTVPTYLFLGLPPHTVIGTNKLSATMGMANASRIFLKKKLFNPKLWIPAMIASVFGAMTGAIAVHYIQAAWLQKFLPIIILLLILYAVMPKHFSQAIKKNIKPKILSSSIIASLIGFYDGFFGPGTGSFWSASLMYFYKMNILEATAVAKLMNFIANFVALMTFLIYGNVNYFYGGIMGLSMMFGAFIAAHSAFKFGVNYIRWVLVIAVGSMAIILLLRSFSLS